MFDKIAKGRWWDFPMGLVQGCTPVSDACDHCWLLGMRHRFKQGFASVQFNPDPLKKLKRKKPAAYAVWSDLYHTSVSKENLCWTMDRISIFPHHVFFALTKRPERAAEFHKNFPIPDNLWIGTTIENQKWADIRLPWLLKCNTPNRFISVEPMLAPISITNYLEDQNVKHKNGRKDLSFKREGSISLCICGCESGPGRRRTNYNWVRDLRDQCVKSKIPFFLKQLEIMGTVVKAPELDFEQYLQLPKRVFQ